MLDLTINVKVQVVVCFLSLGLGVLVLGSENGSSVWKRVYFVVLGNKIVTSN